MQQLTTKIEGPAKADFKLTLPFDIRKKSRFRATLDNGSEVAVVLPRGGTLRHGDLLQGNDGAIIEVQAAPQTLSIASTQDPFLFARACYHLGNRHVPLQIGEGWVRYEHDHVLDEMVSELGLNVSCEKAPFEPEAGAYNQGSGGGHHHHH